MMNYREIIHKCEEYKIAVRKEKKLLQMIERMQQRAQQLRDSVLLPSTAMDGMPHSHNAGDKLASYVAELDPIQNEIDELYTELLDRVSQSMLKHRELRKWFENVRNDQQREVLYQRYLDGEETEFATFEEIADIMNFTPRYVRQLHKKAIEQLQGVEL